MTIGNWLGESGDWNTGSLWSGGIVPNSTIDATITAAGTYTVTIQSGESFNVAGATLDNPFATLDIGYSQADLSLGGGVFDLAAGLLTLNGTIADGTIDLAGGSFAVGYAVLSDVTVVGQLNLGPNSDLDLTNGSVVKSAVAGQQGTIALTSGQLQIGDGETLVDDLLAIGAPTDQYFFSQLDLGGTFTIDQHSTLSLAGAQSTVFFNQPGTASEVVNDGLIALTGTADTVSGGIGGFINAGSISIGTLDLLAISLGTNYGVPQGSYVNSGVISIATGGTLMLDADVSAASFGTVHNNGGTVVLAGTFDNTHNVITIGTTGPFSDVVLQGTLVGGTIDPAGGVLAFEGGTLAGVTWNAASFDVAAARSITIENGLTLAPGGKQLSVEGALIVADGETLSGDTIALSGIIGGALTLAATTVLTSSGNAALTGSVVNLGSIAVGSGTLAVDFTAAQGHGSIAVAPGATLVADGVFGLAALGHLNDSGALSIGGTLLNAGQTLTVAAGTSAADLLVTGTIAGGTLRLAGGSIATSAGATFSDVDVQGPLMLTGAGAALAVENGLTLTGSLGTGPGTLGLSGPNAILTFADGETLDNVTITAGNAAGYDQVQIASTLTLGQHALFEATGGGSVSLQSGTLVNKGTIAAIGSLSTVSIYSVLHNSGSLVIGQGATLGLDEYSNGTIAITSIGSVINQGGVLELGGAFDNTGNTIDLAPGGAFADLQLDSFQLTGGAIKSDGGSIGFDGVLLSDVNFDGTLDLSAAYASLQVADVTLAGKTGAGVGEILLTGSKAVLEVGIGGFGSDSETLGNGTVVIGNAAGGSDEFNVLYGTTLTLAKSLVIDNVGTAGVSQLDGQGTLINLGTIIAASAGGVLEVDPSYGGSFTNLGTIVVDTGATLDLSVNGTLGGFGDVALDGGVLELGGVIQNAGSTLAATSTGLLSNVELAGVVVGGTIAEQGGTLTYLSGTLDGVAVQGALDLATRTSTLTVLGGLSFVHFGTIDLTAPASTLSFADSETLDQVLINIGNAGTAYNQQDLILTAATLTLGAAATLVDGVAGGVADFELNEYGQAFDNEGTIIAAGAGAILSVGAEYYSPSYTTNNAFANSGTVIIGAGATFNVVESGSLQSLGRVINNGTLELTGSYSNSGVYTVASGQVLTLNGNLSGGTLMTAGGSLQFGNATLNNVDLVAGSVALTAGDGGLTLEGTSTLQPPSGQTALLVEADFTHLILASGETVDHLVASFATGALSFDIEATSYGSATFGAHTTFEVLGTGSELYAVGAFDIEAQSDFDPGTITSQGLINVGSGADFVVEVSSFANTGTIALTSDASVIIGSYTSLSAAGLGHVSGSGGTLVIGGTFDLGGGTLDLKSASAISDVLVEGTIANGTVIADGGTFSPQNNSVLANVTIDGPLIDNLSGSEVNVAGSLTLQPLGGTVTIAGAGSELAFLGTQTFDQATVILSGGPGDFQSNAGQVQYPGLTTTGSLTLGRHLLVENPNPGTGGGLGGPGAIINLGTIAVGAGAVIDVTPYGSSFSNLFVNQGVVTVGNGGTFAIDTEFTTAGIGTVIEAGGTLALAGEIDNTGATIDVTQTGSLDRLVFGAIAEGQTYVDGAFVSGGTIRDQGGSISFLGYDSFSGVAFQGPLTVAAGAELSLYGASSVSAIGGGAGTITVAGELDLYGETLTNAAIDFSGAAASLFVAPGSLAAPLAGFSAGDTIEVSGGSITTLTYSNLDLVAFDGTTAVATFAVGAGYVAADFSFTQDPYSDDFITTSQVVTQPAPCYAAGTAIATPAGDRAVESLAIGDMVSTLSGGPRAIKWIGRRSYLKVAGDRDILPVVIRAGALAYGIPRRDLAVSPKHAMFLDEVLIPAELLVNGHSIYQLKTVEELRYFHVELDSHDILLAEGAPAESFVDCESRTMFENVADASASNAASWLLCAPLVEEGETLEKVRRRIDARVRRVA